MFLEYNLVILPGGKLSKYLLEYQIKYPISILQMFWGLLEIVKLLKYILVLKRYWFVSGRTKLHLLKEELLFNF